MNATVPQGWTPKAWIERLNQMANICYSQKTADELRQWAYEVAKANGLVDDAQPT